MASKRRRRGLPLLFLVSLLALAPTTDAALRSPAAPHYNVIALRVEFQPEENRFTTGDGTFGNSLFDTLQVNIDPLPHDAAYFEAHLAFLEDYVARVSNGRTTVSTHLLPEVIRVSKTMRAYSPTGPQADTDAELAKLAALVQEAWQEAAARIAFDMSRFDPATTSFIIFHAGAGRDIELIGTALDKTPEDLPSLYFGPDALQRLLGNEPIVFNGFPIRNSAVLPETQSRVGFDPISQRRFVAEFSINGFIAASFFSYLGVPDLFDTITGQSGIGPFGLMDPYGIFAYNGLFPPAPMAWTRYYLGWVDPILVTGAGPETITLRAGAGDVAMIPISDAEYFLVENRNRDPDREGLIMRIWKDGAFVEQRVSHEDETFTRFDQTGFMGGVLVSVNNYDWALPGGVDEDGNILEGGILIWHVDERILADGLASNRVNADPRRRAVSLKEADGAQDIGFPSPSPFGPQAHVGTPFDFFFKDNPIRVATSGGRTIRLYENRFGPDTIPNSNSNEGGASFVVLEDFSAPGPEMTFVYRRSPEAGISPLTSLWKPTGLRIGAGGAIGPLGGDFVAVFSGPPVGSLQILSAERLEVKHEWHDAVARPIILQDGRVIVLREEEFHVIRPENEAVTLTLSLGSDIDRFTGSVVSASEQGAEVVYAGIRRGEQTGYARILPNTRMITTVFPPGGVTSLAIADGHLVVSGRDGTAVQGTGHAWAYQAGPQEEVGQAVFGRDGDGLFGVVPLPASSEMLFLKQDGAVSRLNTQALLRDFTGAEGAMSPLPVLVDLDGNGSLDVLFTAGRYLVALSQEGAIVRDFPVRLSAPALAQPLVARFAEDERWTVFLALEDGYLHALTGSRQVAGFPLPVGHRITATPMLRGNVLYAISNDGGLKAWELPMIDTVWWGAQYAGDRNESFVRLQQEPADQDPGARLLVVEETYNWPNPVRGGSTNLRFMMRRDGRMVISITDMAGAFIDRLVVEAVRGNVPTEIPWNAVVSSGIYFARFTAEDGAGSTDSRLVKIAVIR